MIWNFVKRVHRKLLPADEDIGWVPYLWLIYMFGFLVPVFFLGTAAEALFASLVCLVFLVLYFRAHWRSGRAVLPYIAGITIVGMVLLPIHASAICFFIFAGAFGGRAGPPKTGVKLVAAITVVMVTQQVLLGHPWFMWVIGGVFIVLISMVNIYYAQLSRKNAQLKLSQEEIKQLAALAERERIARDLHDLLGHTLSVIAVKAELAGKLTERDLPKARAEIEDVCRISRDALKQVREAVAGYRHTGLAGELANARLAMEAMDIRFGYDPPPEGIHAAAEAVLGMIVREAVTNVVRHARADRCRIVFRQERKQLVMEVRDNGVGGELKEGGGITGMRSRLQEVGGTLEILRGEGWHVAVRLPMTTNAKEEEESVGEQDPAPSSQWTARPERGV